jgi:transposase
MTTTRPRYRRIDRDTCSTASLDDQLPLDHPARTIWAFTLGLDLSAFDNDTKAVEGRPGRPANNPRLLFALWLFALIDGVCRARELARRCRRDVPYQWLCGGAPPDYHTLSDFHAQHHERLHRLFVDHVTALRSEGLVELRRVAIDGIKRPGQAGNATYRREPTLARHLAEAEDHVRAWEQGRAADPSISARSRAARFRAARERAARIRRAVDQVRQLQAARAASRRSDTAPEDARASEADPDAIRMKQGDGGFRIGYNVQTMTDAGCGLVVTTTVINQANDTGQLGAMLDQVQREQGVSPVEVLVDSGYATADDIDRAERAGQAVFMPPRDADRDRAAGRDPYAAKRRDTPAVAGWRARMGTPQAQQVYRARAGLAEIIHARMVTRGWFQFRLRGLVKAGAEALWQALAHNVSRLLAMGRLVARGPVRAASR